MGQFLHQVTMARTQLSTIAYLAFIASVVGCMDPQSSGSGPQMDCAPNSENVCRCPDQRLGTRRCAANGSFAEQCQCGEPRIETRCDDEQDDDNDGLVDCHDEDCADHPACEGSEVCDDGLDNDEDGLIDHPADPECLSPLTPSEAAVLPLSSPLSILLAATLLLGIGLLHAPDPT